MVILRGCHLLKHSSTLQTSVGLSSAEAEYYALTKGASFALGVQSFLRDLGIDCSIVLYCDSSSARALALRRGIGRIRHIETRFLWLQERLALKHMTLKTVKGTSNPSDVLTKQLAHDLMVEYCARLGQKFIDPMQ